MNQVSWNNENVDTYLKTHKIPQIAGVAFRNELRAFLLEYNHKAQNLLSANSPEVAGLRRDWLMNLAYMLYLAIEYSVITDANTIREIQKFLEYIHQPKFSNRIKRSEFDEKVILNACTLMEIAFNSLKIRRLTSNSVDTET